MSVKCITIVLANWCPHCVPLSLQNCKDIAKKLRVSLRILDIEVPSQLKVADTLVEEYGDWTEDYLIPQVFLEYNDGKICHILTGSAEGISKTEAFWKKYLSSNHYKKLTSENTRQK
ncbi:MAG: hypothetical protein QG670_1747 [Thermoproteota archaeon]|nr:hypothetical protein [Thermoproteota archaeon]